MGLLSGRAQAGKFTFNHEFRVANFESQALMALHDGVASLDHDLRAEVRDAEAQAAQDE